MDEDDDNFGDIFKDPLYYSCVFHKHPKLIKQPRGKMFINLGDDVVKCKECGQKYERRVSRDKGVKTITLTPIERPPKMLPGWNFCTGGTNVRLIWVEGKKPKWVWCGIDMHLMFYLPPFNELLSLALDTINRLFQGKTRKSIEYPYVVHPAAVALILARHKADEETIIAGYLHDILEDVDPKIYDADNMVHDFGTSITEIVEEVTEKKDPMMSREEARRTWKERKLKYLARLEKDSKKALMVCAADKIHNLGSLCEAHKMNGCKAFESFNAPVKEIIWYYDEVVGLLKKRLKNSIMEELEAVHNKFMEFAETCAWADGSMR